MKTSKPIIGCLTAMLLLAAPAAASASGGHGCAPSLEMTHTLTAGSKTRCSTARNVERYIATHPIDGAFRVNSIRFRCYRVQVKRTTCRNAAGTRRVSHLSWRAGG